MGKPNEGLLLLDKSLHVNSGNIWAEMFLQQPLVSLIGKHILQLLPPECTNKIFTGGSLAKEAKASFGNLMIFYKKVSLPDISGIIILRKVHQGSEPDYSINSLKELMSETKGLVNTGPIEVFIADAEGAILEAIVIDSKEFYGIQRSFFLGKNAKELEQKGFFVPSLTRLVLEAGKQVTAIKETKTGKRLMSTAQPVYNRPGKVTQIVIISYDVTNFYILKGLLSKIEESMQNNLTEIDNLQQDAAADGKIIKSPVMIRIWQNIQRIAAFDSTVLFLGETGTGKGTLAKLLHKISPRNTGEFVQVNCGAIPENLMESEFFGYAPGAFTGASKTGKKGLVELAQYGTLFLDEVDCLSANLQAKLLHVIQEHEFMPVGGTKKVTVDARFIAATNNDLQKLVKDGHFREDLYYRLNVVPIVVPPLRERKEEIIPMASFFLQRLCKKYSVERKFSATAVNTFLKYAWPGNVRELENMIERCFVTSSGTYITEELVNEYLQEAKVKTRLLKALPETLSHTTTLDEKMEKLEKTILEDALRKHGSTRKVAKQLGINQSTVVRKMKKYGLKSSASST